MKKPAKVSNSVHRALHIYTLTASAAGVATLALASPGEAEIIYTPANAYISGYEYYPLDLDGDGTTDVSFTAFFGTGTVYRARVSVVPEVVGNEIAVMGRKDVTDLPAGHRIGPRAKFTDGSVEMGYGYFNTSNFRYKCTGSWKNKSNRYLGLKFLISGEVHYGWIRLSENCGWLTLELNMTGYAYETIPNKAIKAGQEQGTDDGVEQSDTPNASEAAPATLGHLARGAQALGFWRRKGVVVEQQNAQ